MRIATLALSLPFWAGLAASPAQQVALGSYAVPKSLMGSAGIAAGPDGAVWFTGYYGNSIGRIAPSGVLTQYAMPTSQSDPWGIAAGPDGALWFTEEGGNNIGRITTTGAITEYPVLTAYAGPWAIVAGPDGALWFTEYYGNKIGRVTTAGVFTEYPLPPPDNGYNANPFGIAAGPDGALWFAEQGGNAIGRITTMGVLTEYPLPTTHSDPDWIAAGPDGALWFTEFSKNSIGRITAAGAITQYQIQENKGPLGIAAGPDGAMWFTENVSGLGRIDAAGNITQYDAPVAPYLPEMITLGPHGDLWFSEGQGIGQGVFTTAGLSVSPPTGYFTTALNFSGSGFTPGENVQIYSSGVGSPVMASATADTGGSFQAAARAPQSGFGPRFFLAMGQTSRRLAAASFSMAAHIVLTPNSAAPGSTVAVSGYGFYTTFDPDNINACPINIYWNNPRTLLGAIIPDYHGGFEGSASFTFTVPSTAPDGANGVIASQPYSTQPAVSAVPFTVE